MTLTFEFDLDRVKTNQHARHLGQRLFRSKVIIRTHRHTHVQRTDGSTRTTNVVGIIICKRIQSAVIVVKKADYTKAEWVRVS